MIQLRDRRILIDEKPALVFAGEIHYYRLARKDWEDRVRKLKDLGCDTVASYIPWIIHEEREGQIDVTGRFRPENNVGEFIDLCHDHGLRFMARPGPFVMAEMKNEGIPFWVYRKYPEAIPVTWKGQKGTSFNLDYLNEGFLEAAARWYGGIMPVLAARLQTKGGPVIGVQLDNEIGMLQWVTNEPDLCDDVLCDFARWLGTRYDTAQMAARYPFDFNDPATRATAIRNPKPEYAAAFHRDYGDFERDRIARYVAALRKFAEANGVKDIPFLVNIHGTGGGRSTPFPIGISQLFQSYTQDTGYLAGSDHYLGELTRGNAADMYVINAFMAAVNRPEQPLASFEFEVGSGDYGETGGMRQSGASADFKVRLCVAQGNRLLNYYLLAGGTNPPLLDPRGDGNDRAGTTGQRHGFAAPISPEGELDPTYHALKDTTHTLLAVKDKLADMDEEHDGIALAFQPNLYKTDFFQPGPMQEIVQGLESARGPLDDLARALLMTGYRFPAIDIENRPLNSATKAIAVAPAPYMDAAVQQKLLDFVRAGGGLLLYGDLPEADMEGKPCTILADAIGTRPNGLKEGSSTYYPSLKGEAWMSDEPEVRVWRTRVFAEPKGGVFLRMVGSGEPCGIETEIGRGRTIVMASGYPFHERAYGALFERLGGKAAIRHDWPYAGVFTTTIANRKGERFLNVINLDSEDKPLHLRENGQAMFGGNVIRMAGRTARLLPMNVQFGPIKVAYATTEIDFRDANTIRFRNTGREERIVFEGDVEAIGGGHAMKEANLTVVTSSQGVLLRFK